MRLHGVLADVLGSPARVKVARALVRVTAGRWTGREVARAAGCSAPQAVHALRQLEELGFVSRRAVGRAHEWTLVEDHVLVGPLRILFEFEADLPNGFRRDLRNELRDFLSDPQDRSVQWPEAPKPTRAMPTFTSSLRVRQTGTPCKPR